MLFIIRRLALRCMDTPGKRSILKNATLITNNQRAKRIIKYSTPFIQGHTNNNLKKHTKIEGFIKGLPKYIPHKNL